MSELVNDNRKYGRQGFISLLDDAERQDLMFLWQENNWKYDVARDYIKKTTGIEPSRKALYDLRKKFIALFDARHKQPEGEVDWENLKAIEAYSGIPHDSYLVRALYAIWKEIRHMAKLGVPESEPIPLTYRDLKWLSKVLVYHPAIEETADRRIIAAMYATREKVADWSGSKIQREDLDEWLFFEPWRDGEAMEYYLSLIEKGSIPDLETTRFTSRALVLGQQVANLDLSRLVAIHNLGMFEMICEMTGANKYLLPTMRLDDNEETKGSISDWVETLKGEATEK